MDRRELIKRMQQQIDRMQGLGKPASRPAPAVFGPFEKAFPEQTFPVAALHEFISYAPAEAASTTGFIAALLGKLGANAGTCLWVGRQRQVFPPGLTPFGIDPGRLLFVDAPKPADLLWTLEEALKSDALTAVVGELKELGFTESRRLQLAIERSGVSCFLHRHRPCSENQVASTTRWKITPLASQSPEGLPGVCHPFWKVELLKVRNGRPGSWQLGWHDNRFTEVRQQQVRALQPHQIQTG